MKSTWSLFALTLLATLTTASAQLDRSPQTPVEALVESGVYDELAASADGRAYVIVMLAPVPLQPRGRQDVQQSAVAERQSRVLSRLVPGDLDLRYQYRNFAGLTGRISAVGLQRLAADPEVVSIGVDGRGGPALNSSVPFIRADQVHASGFTGEGVTVAVLDSGIDTDHPDISDDVAPGARTFLFQGGVESSGAEDTTGHGTAVAGIITSKGTVANIGVAPDADILAVKVFDGSSGWISDWTAGVDYVVSVAGNYDRLCAINMSLVSDQLFSQCPADNAAGYNQALQAAILAARNAGIVTFAATGNDGSCTAMASPAALSAAVPVIASFDTSSCIAAATGGGDGGPTCDEIMSFSNRHGCNELAAPGNWVNGPQMGGGVAPFTGTSFAAPHATGVAALMAERAEMPADHVISILYDTGAPTTDPCNPGANAPRLDALAATEAVAWSDLGSGLAGTHGTPSLAGSGLLTPDSPVDLVLTDARENSAVYLVAGFVPINLPLYGGTLVPAFSAPDGLLLILPSDSNGQLVAAGPWPVGVPAEFPLYVQTWIQDPNAPFGLAASNAITASTP